MPRNKKGWLTLLLCLFIPFAVIMLSGELCASNFRWVYTALHLPPFTPPGMVFALVWPVLCLLMGLSAYLIARSRDKERDQALFVLGLLLVFLFLWPLFFFNLQFFAFSAFILVLLLLLNFSVYHNFKLISPTAAKLMLPYIIWSLYAFYLNVAVIILN